DEAAAPLAEAPAAADEPAWDVDGVGPDTIADDRDDDGAASRADAATIAAATSRPLPAAATEFPDSVTPARDDRPDGHQDDRLGERAKDANQLVVMQDVARRFEDRDVVHEINLTVPRGTILGIIGPSGAGKTTTIRMLTGAIAPTRGRIRVMGTEPKRFSRAERERIGYMPQLFTLYDDLTAGENVDFVASLFGMLFRRRRRRVKEVLKVVDLWDARKRRAGRLSGGMQRRLELACALVHEPELIILDEPTAGIDPLLRGSIWEELHRLRDSGRTLLVTTQHVSEAEECDAVAMIVGGTIIALATPDELRRMATNGDLLDIETASVYDATKLIGTEGVAEVTQDGPRHLRVVVDDAGSALPDVVDRIRAAGVEIESAREHRLSFDEIFAILVARYHATVGPDGEAGGAGASSRSGPSRRGDDRDPRGEGDEAAA
ncbi:MAG TPA: ABC transporter ATP-binding protein, partial [Candidatus Limnocylindrales bacterium]|nr:ABC transporter ATP-binding protein [Candidatus Limnocylindrales bacterium]